MDHRITIDLQMLHYSRECNCPPLRHISLKITPIPCESSQNQVHFRTHRAEKHRGKSGQGDYKLRRRNFCGRSLVSAATPCVVNQLNASAKAPMDDATYEPA